MTDGMNPVNSDWGIKGLFVFAGLALLHEAYEKRSAKVTVRNVALCAIFFLGAYLVEI